MIYERIKQVAADRGVTLGGLAKQAGLDRTALYHLRRHKRSPNLATVGNLLRALPDVDARWLVVGDQ